MKKVLLVALALLLVVCLGGGAVALAWANAGALPPAIEAGLLGEALSPVAVNWHQPVLGGLLYRQQAAAADGGRDFGTLEAPALALAPPEGYDSQLQVSRDKTVVYSGPAAGFSDQLLQPPGLYEVTLWCTKAQSGRGAYGDLEYRASFTVPVPPEPPWPELPVFQAGRAELQQGDIFAMQVLYLPEGIRPEATTDLGMAVFTPKGEGRWTAAVPIGNTRAPGDYTVRVQAGEQEWEVTVQVLAFPFVEQDLTIDLSDPVIGEANSPAAYQEYRETIPPLFETADDETYWEGLFIQPAEGRISTEFGTIRYTNGDYANPGIHWGMDIANAEGTPVVAPNNGRVVLAKRLLNTGNTIVIEHGGGLKSYYFHLNELKVRENQMVHTGDLIGAVGTTGYSTGPHLHFEVRIGNQAVSPHMLFEPTDGLYSLEEDVG